MVTNGKLATCIAAAQGYKDGVAYALAQLNLPNVVMYVDAGNSGWLGWNDNLGTRFLSHITGPYTLQSSILFYLDLISNS